MDSELDVFEIDPDKNYYPEVLEFNKKYEKETIWTIFEKETKANPDKPSVAIREYDEKTSTYLPYKTISNTEIYNTSTKFGAALKKLGLKPLDIVYVSLEKERWEVPLIRASIYRQAGNYLAITDDLLFFKRFNQMIKLSLPRIIITELSKIIQLLDIIKEVHAEIKGEMFVKSVIILPNEIGPDQKNDSITEEMKKLAKELKIELYHYEEAIKIGEKNPCEPAEQKAENPAVIILSSGTSNTVKPVVLSHKNVILSYYYIENSTAAKLKEYTDKSKSIGVLLPSYFGHVSDLSAGCSSLLGKGLLYNMFLSDGMKNAAEDLCMAKLRLMFNSSTFYINIYNLAQSKIKSGIPEPGVIDFIKNKVLGGCLEIIINTSSYLPTHIMKWYAEKLGMKVGSHFCLTECPFIFLDFPDFKGEKIIPDSFIGYKPKYGLVKIQEVDNKEIKLKEKVNDIEIITGELLVKNEAVLSEYYKNSELNSLYIDKNGYFHTQDLVSWNTKDEIFTLIGRLDSVVNIRLGFLYPVSTVENQFLDVPLFKNLIIYCDKEDSNIFCITNVNTDMLAGNNQLSEEIRNKLKEFNKLNDEERKKLLREQEVKKVVNEEMNKIYELKGFNYLVKFTEIILNPYECSTANGMLTRNGKIIRKVVVDKFMNEINEFRKNH